MPVGCRAFLAAFVIAAGIRETQILIFPVLYLFGDFISDYHLSRNVVGFKSCGEVCTHSNEAWGSHRLPDQFGGAGPLLSTTPNLGDLYTGSGQILQASFSAVSKPIFASKY